MGTPAAPPLLSAAEALLDDPSPEVRGAAVWAVGRLSAPDRFGLLRRARIPGEADPAVRAEWADFS